MSNSQRPPDNSVPLSTRGAEMNGEEMNGEDEIASSRNSCSDRSLNSEIVDQFSELVLTLRHCNAKVQPARFRISNVSLELRLSPWANSESGATG